MAFTYTLVDGFAIAFLMILFFSTRDKFVHLTQTRCFRIIVLMAAAVLFCDMLAWQLDGRECIICRYALWLSNISCYIISGILSLTWLYYTGLKANRLNRLPKHSWILITLPCLLLIACSVSTPWTHWLFSLDANNTYQRGSLFYLQMIIPFGYIFIAAIWAFYCAGKARLRQQRNECLALASFIVFPTIGGMLQLAFYGVSLAWPCTALSLMLVYVSMQNQKISLDALTGLNNRGQLDKHLYECVEHSDNDQPFAFFMLDIDEFKKINDEFGHIAGDAALIDAANLLKKSLLDTNSFLARYGGDEFAIIYYYAKEEQLKSLINRINEEAQRCCHGDSKPYKLVFSIGYVCYDKHRYANYQDMITAADAQMYLQKRKHKAER